MYILIGITVICVTIIISQLIKRSCKHTYDFDFKEEQSKNGFGQYYKIVTSQCTKCGKVKVSKHKVN